MTVSTKEVTEKIEGFFQSAESKLSEMKDGARKSQAVASKNEALGHYLRTLRNEHVDAAFDIVSDVLQNKDIKNEDQLQKELQKIVSETSERKDLKAFRDVKTVEELKKLVEENPDGAKEYFSARALNLLISPPTNDQQSQPLAASLNFTTEKNSSTPFDQFISTHSQFVFSAKKEPFYEEMKNILSTFSGDDVAKSALLSKLEASISDETLNSPNVIQGIVSEAMSDPNSPLSLFLYRNEAYGAALQNLQNKETPKGSFRQSITSYVGTLRSKVENHIQDENQRISDRVTSLDTLLEKAEKAANEQAAAGETEKLLSQNEYRTKILRKLNINEGKSDFRKAYVSYSADGHSYSETFTFNTEDKDQEAQTKKYKRLFDWLNSADEALHLKLTYDDGEASFWMENKRFLCSENTVPGLPIKPDERFNKAKSTQAGPQAFLSPAPQQNPLSQKSENPFLDMLSKQNS